MIESTEDKASYGLSSESTVEEVIIRHDGTATRYKVVVEALDLDALREEKEDLEMQLTVRKPTDEELIEVGKGVDPYYTIDRETIQERIARIDSILGQ